MNDRPTVPQRRYREPRPYDRGRSELALASPDVVTIQEALVEIALGESDVVWAQATVSRFARHANRSVRAVVATCLGHLGRLHETVDRLAAERVLRELATDADPVVRGLVGDARSDLAMFQGSGRRRDPAG